MRASEAVGVALNLAFRLLELSIRIFIQLLGLAFGLLGKVIAAWLGSRSAKPSKPARMERHKPPRLPPPHRRKRQWRKTLH